MGGGRSVLVLDEGTSNVKAFAFSEDARVLSKASSSLRSTYPSQGLVEQSPEDIWTLQVRTLRKAASKVPLESVAGLGVTNQRETLVVWDAKTGAPLCDAMVWQDKRGVPIIEALSREERAMVQDRTGLIPDSYFSAPKLRWLLDKKPKLRSMAEKGEVKFGTVDTYLVWRLTEGRVHATDTSNASRTMLLNLKNLEWDSEVLKVMRIPGAMLPEIRASSGDYGEVDSGILGRSVPITGVAGDQQAALFGHAALKRGDIKSTFGTGTFVLANTGGTVVRSRTLLSTVGWTLGKKTTYALEGSILASGSSMRWLVNEARLASDMDEMERLAAQAKGSGGVFFVPALSGLGSPYWDPHARGLMIGMTHGTTRAEVLRACVESAGLQTKDVIEEMAKELGRPVSTIKVDGGASESDLFLKVLVDVTGLRAERPEFVDTTARGAGFLAGIFAGVWKASDLVSLLGEVDTFEPSTTRSERERLYRGWKEAVNRSRGWVTASSRG